MRFFFFFGLILWGVLAPVMAGAADGRITAIRTGGNSEIARLVVESAGPLEISMLLLSKPYRLVMDMPQALWQVEGRAPEGRLLRAGLLKGYRFGHPEAGRSRLVIDLAAPAIPVRAEALPPVEGRHRLVIDFEISGATAFHVAAQALKQQDGAPVTLDEGTITPAPTRSLAMILPEARPRIGIEPPPPPPRPVATTTLAGGLLPVPRPGNNGIAITTAPIPPPPPKPATRKWVVFIDAGHGGKDPGAIGVSGVREKDITLKAAHELARQLNATGRISARLTREGDQYHRLRKRIDIARKAQADIFISLHADAAHNKKAKGVSIFTLSDKASDKEAEYLARRENRADLIGGPDLGIADPVVNSTLLGMFQRESMNQSSVLAAHLLAEFDGIKTDQRGHRFAGFAVLKAPDVPSVLIEMGFLTNREDENRLKSAGYRRDLMKRVAAAVLRYLEQNNLVASATP